MIILPVQSSAHQVEVPLEYDGQRIDNFLRRILKGVPKSLVYRLLRQGQVRVNSGRIRPGYRLRAGDVIRIPPLRVSGEDFQVSPPRAMLEKLQDAVLLEDRDVMVLNKPAGVPVHRGSGVDIGIIEALRIMRSEISFLELAHRLDRETSGCLVLAKTPESLRAIHASLHSGTADKRYLTLVRGRWQGGVREVSVSLRKNVLRGGERMVVVDDAGRLARSRFRPVSTFRKASLLDVGITTGRTHQVRVHAAHICHPIAGDTKYGDCIFNREMSHHGLRRLFLHAHSLSMPLGEREISVSAPLDGQLKAVLEYLEANA